MGRLRGDEITFTAGDARYKGKVTGNTHRGDDHDPDRHRPLERDAKVAVVRRRTDTGAWHRLCARS